MISIATTHQPATDLGYLLHKNPSRVHEVELTFGKGIVVFPEATNERCEAAIIVQIDPVALVRGKGEGRGSIAQYVNDRPYVASSFTSVALVELLSTAINGKCKDRPELVDTAIPLEINIPVLSCRSGESSIRELFEPLGYNVQATELPLDDQFPEWGASGYFQVCLTGLLTVRDALRHLYVLLPVLDARKHYFLDRNEIDKLVKKGEGWLADHPKKNWIVRSYLSRKPSFVRDALEQMANIEPELESQEEALDEALIAPVEIEDRKKSLHEQRHDHIVEIVRANKPKSVVDLGCGDGKLIRKLVPIQGIERIVGMDVSYYELEKATRIMKLEERGPALRERIQFIHGSLMYRDARLEGFDLATVIEVIEHLDPPRLSAFERVVFECAKPRTVLVTTPNRDYNVLYVDMPGLRHEDHRFEWSRDEFKAWCERVAERFGYRVEIEGLGEADETLGSPSQLGVFTR